MTKYYPIANTITLSRQDMLSVGVEKNNVTYRGKVITLSDIDGDVYIMAKKKLDGFRQSTQYLFRAPLESEWFISGAEPEAYKSICDLSTSFHIAELVLVRTITITTQVEITL